MSRPSEPGEAMELRRTIAALEEEVAQLRRRLREPRDHEVARLERELADAHRTIERLRSQNDKLATVLEEAREQLSVLRAEVEKLTTPPNNFGTVLQVNEDGTLDVMTGNRKLRVAAQPTIEVKQLSVGQEVLLNESYNVVDVRGFERSGEVVQVREKLEDGRVVVIAHA
ncbi:MAG TPA: proteasome ATPase, partial [Acidimicrobiia bacterium]